MRNLFLLLPLITLIGCESSDRASGGDVEIPSEYHGNWIFDEDSAIKAIESMPLSEEDKLNLQSSFVGIARGEARQVDSTGRITGDSYPDELTIRLQVVEERKEGLIAKTLNSMNPDAKQFTLNSVINGVWRSRLLDESLQPVAGIPDDFWKRPE